MGKTIANQYSLLLSATVLLITCLLFFFSTNNRTFFAASIRSTSGYPGANQLTVRGECYLPLVNPPSFAPSLSSSSSISCIHESENKKPWSNTPTDEANGGRYNNKRVNNTPSFWNSGDDKTEQSDFATKTMAREVSKREKLEWGLARARAAIYAAARSRNYSAPPGFDGFSDFIPLPRLYWNAYAFYRSHMEMLKRFKVWTYKEGEPPMFHEASTLSTYGIDGQFMDEMDLSSRGRRNGNRFLAHHPDEAHCFFLPISLLRIKRLVLQPISPRVYKERIAEDYVNLIARKYPYWNRSQGADHFVLSCHDSGPSVSDSNPRLMRNLIRALCNANLSEGFHPTRDVSIPEINILNSQRLVPPSLGIPFSKRRNLAFFAGRSTGYIRKVLFKHWKGKAKEKEVLVYEELPKGMDYFKMMGESKFCLCPSGYEVASPRIVEAVFAGCVPVLISSGYSPPFADVLDYSQFSVRIPVEKIPEIKSILKGVSSRQYMKLVRGVKAVKWHFTLNRPSQPFDMIHMVLHSVWLRRLDLKLPV